MYVPKIPERERVVMNMPESVPTYDASNDAALVWLAKGHVARGNSSLDSD